MKTIITSILAAVAIGGFVLAFVGFRRNADRPVSGGSPAPSVAPRPALSAQSAASPAAVPPGAAPVPTAAPSPQTGTNFDRIAAFNAARALPGAMIVDMEQMRKRDEAERNMLIERDKRLGLNADIREKEARLKEASAQLKKGQSREEVLAIMGYPTVAMVRVRQGQVSDLVPIPRDDLLTIHGTIFFFYSPHPTEINRKLGDSFQVLTIYFDDKVKVRVWEWLTPEYL